MKAVVETRDIRGDSAPSGAAGLPKAVVRLGWVSFLTDVSSEMIVPLLPAFLATLSGVPAMALGWIEGVAETTASFVKIVSGRFTDRAKAKKPLVFLGYGLSSLARPLIGLAPSWPAVVLHPLLRPHRQGHPHGAARHDDRERGAARPARRRVRPPPRLRQRGRRPRPARRGGARGLDGPDACGRSSCWRRFRRRCRCSCLLSE